jgi:hypothetical protein
VKDIELFLHERTPNDKGGKASRVLSMNLFFILYFAKLCSSYPPVTQAGMDSQQAKKR